jgi:carbon monoxide dehydrogenase subunit G
MKLANEFTVPVPIEQAWAVLTDLELIAPCMPGAQLTGVTDGVYTGKVKIKVGPVTAEYAGTAKFAEKDDAGYRAVIDARGRDSRGQGNATAIIAAQLRADGASTMVTVDTDLAIAGRIAQFGSGMIKEVSAKLLGQFVQCLEQKLGAGSAQEQTRGADSAAAGPATAESAQDAAGTAPLAADRTAHAAAGATAGATASGGTAAAGTAAAGTAAEQAPLDLMSLAGRAVYKRLLPLAAAIVVVVAIIVILLVR